MRNVQLSGTGALADLLCEEIKSKLGIKRARRYVRLSERVVRSSLSRRRADREVVVRVAAGARRVLTALIERVNVRVDQINIQMRPTGLSALFDTAVTPSLREETAILSVPAPPA